jgi:hypothetical protein
MLNLDGELGASNGGGGNRIISDSPGLVRRPRFYFSQLSPELPPLMIFIPYHFVSINFILAVKPIEFDGFKTITSIFLIYSLADSFA